MANRVLPRALTRRGAATSARRLAAAAEDPTAVDRVVAAIASDGGLRPDGRVVHDVLVEVAARFHDVALVATREAERRAELAALAPEVLDVPSLDSDVNDLATLWSVVCHLRDR